MRHETIKTGKLITFEGGEGAGKSTQVSILANRLTQSGHQVVATREPGGSPAAEEIREVLLSGKAKPFGPFAEALLFSVARQSHVDTVISDALAKGRWVISDRFLDSTRAYQGVGGGVPQPLIGALERLTLKGLLPNLTIVLDLPVEEGLRRIAKRPGTGGPDRFESEQRAQHERIRKAFLDIAEEEPNRCVVVDASKPEALVAEDIWEAVAARLRP
jgi:dTMP kinase